jgi:hypothetical protein
MTTSLDNFRSDFDTEWNKYGVYHAKGLINNLPNWEEIIKVLNKEIRTQDHNIFTIPSNNNFEIVYKDIIAMKKLSYSDEARELNSMNPNSNDHSIESDATFFFALCFNPDKLKSLFSKSLTDEIDSINKIFDIDASYSSLKIALADKFTPYESHKWHTCIIHLAGTNLWKLRNKEVGLDNSYLVEPGDCLFFKEWVEHELSNDEPRSSLVGRFTLGESHE